MRVRALIVTYQSSNTISRCLESLIAANASRIYVWDNASSETEKTYVEAECRRLGIEFFSSPENIGFGAAINELFKRCGGEDDDLIWVVNPDSFAEPDTLEALTKQIERGADFVSPVVLDERGKIWFAGGEVDLRRGRTEHTNIGANPPPRDSAAYSTAFLSGANFAVKFSTWQSVGGFDERLFLYWEDALLSLDIRARDLNIMVVPAARVTHAQGESSGGGRSAVYYYFAQRNRVLIAGWQGQRRLAVLLGAGLKETLRLLISPVLREDRDRLAKISASIRGVFDGLAKRVGPL